MSDYDLDVLLRSPLDDEPERWQGWPGLAAGVVVAAIVFVLLAVVASNEGDVTTTVTSVPPEPDVVVEETDFPAGYVAVTDEMAYRAEAPIGFSDRVVIPVTMATRRGLDPAFPARPLGGRWVMLTTQGVSVSSQRVVYDRLRPGAFAVEFPAGVGVPESITLVATFNGVTATGEAEVAYTGTPWELAEPLVVDLDTGDRFTIGRLRLGNFLGELGWRIGSADAAIAEVGIELFDPTGTPLGSYFPGPPFLDPEPPAGIIGYIWGPGFNVDQDDAATFRLTVTAQVADAAPANVQLPVPRDA